MAGTATCAPYGSARSPRPVTPRPGSARSPAVLRRDLAFGWGSVLGCRCGVAAMSAWDIAGAIAWPLLFVAQGGMIAALCISKPFDWRVGAWFLSIPAAAALGAGAYCIARLCGAHA